MEIHDAGLSFTDNDPYSNVLECWLGDKRPMMVTSVEFTQIMRQRISRESDRNKNMGIT